MLPRKKIRPGYSIGVVLTLFIGISALAQEDAAPPNDEDEAIEEIVVTAGGRSGDPVDVEARYEELLRSQILRDVEQLRLVEEEEGRWRDSRTDIENPSRIRWGYDPDDEMQMRRNTALQDVNFAPTKPATIFRFEF